MFETNYRNSLPGYTGHVPCKVENDVPIVNREARKHIPGKNYLQLEVFFVEKSIMNHKFSIIHI